MNNASKKQTIFYQNGNTVSDLTTFCQSLSVSVSLCLSFSQSLSVCQSLSLEGQGPVQARSKLLFTKMIILFWTGQPTLPKGTRIQCKRESCLWFDNREGASENDEHTEKQSYYFW